MITTPNRDGDELIDLRMVLNSDKGCLLALKKAGLDQVLGSIHLLQR